VSEEDWLVEKCWDTGPRRGTRAFDLVLCVIGLLFLWPVFCLIALAVKLDDRGPVFFTQRRVGKGFQSFSLIKFRTMVVGADRDGLLTAPRDHRITRVGRFLRDYKLDELPQLINILKGDMQFVGARPEVERYVEMFRAQYATILQECPGITDPATLVYRREDNILSRSNIEDQYIAEVLPHKLRLSMEYQKQRSLLSDMRILVRTVLGLSLSNGISDRQNEIGGAREWEEARKP
jgi:lipopolysaccharide/colanic/teichoic acid biosynthesis glycosyltransferase